MISGKEGGTGDGTAVTKRWLRASQTRGMIKWGMMNQIPYGVDFSLATQNVQYMDLLIGLGRRGE